MEGVRGSNPLSSTDAAFGAVPVGKRFAPCLLLRVACRRTGWVRDSSGQPEGVVVSDRQQPRPHEGETPRDEQSETVGSPYRQQDAPKRDARTPLAWGLLIGFWVILGIALIVLAVKVLA
jgi:hypothetical protein